MKQKLLDRHSFDSPLGLSVPTSSNSKLQHPKRSSVPLIPLKLNETLTHNALLDISIFDNFLPTDNSPFDPDKDIVEQFFQPTLRFWKVAGLMPWRRDSKPGFKVSKFWFIYGHIFRIVLVLMTIFLLFGNEVFSGTNVIFDIRRHNKNKSQDSILIMVEYVTMGFIEITLLYSVYFSMWYLQTNQITKCIDFNLSLLCSLDYSCHKKSQLKEKDLDKEKDKDNKEQEEEFEEEAVLMDSLAKYFGGKMSINDKINSLKSSGAKSRLVSDFEKLKLVSHRCVAFIVFVITFQLSGWLSANYINNPWKPHYYLFSNWFYSSMWGLFVWFPIACSVSLWFIHVTMLHQRRNLLIAFIGAAQIEINKQWLQYSKTNEFWKINTLGFVSNASRSNKMNEMNGMNKINCITSNSKWNLSLIMKLYILFKDDINNASLMFRNYLASYLVCGTMVTILSILLSFVKSMYFDAIMLVIIFLVFTGVVLYCVADLSSTTDILLRLISSTLFDSNQDIKVIRLILMIKNNPCDFTILGIGITYYRLALAFGTIASAFGSVAVKYIVE